MNQASNTLYATYKANMQKVADLKYAAAVLQWDQETYLPEMGANFRGRQIATLSEVAHAFFTDAKVGNLLNALMQEDLDAKERKNVMLSLDDYTRLTKLAPAFVRTMSETVSASYHAWLAARKANDFTIFEPLLTKIVALKRQEADLLGYTGHPYNALLDEYEKGATVTRLDQVFNEVRQPLQNLLADVSQLPKVDTSFLYRHYPKAQQWQWSLYLANQLGFNFKAGRQDVSEHPFSTNFNSHDVRITTRIDENDFLNMTWSTIHEVGHALYEQGIPAEQYGLPGGEYTSLGIHESQSRLWENCVGRSSEFWEYYLPVLKTYFPDQLKNISLPHFVQAINYVKPSFIRTEADELTYHIHVIIRYELEKKLIEGSLEVKDVPGYWNEQYHNYLGIKVVDDLTGCLQDVHWSHGSFGYFATYSLGSFYAAQFWQQAKTDVATLENDMSKHGDTQLLLGWLRSNIHQHGRHLTSEELCTLVTGKGLDSNVFVQYLRQKFISK